MNWSANTLPTQLVIPGLQMGPPSTYSKLTQQDLAALKVILIDDSPFMRDVYVETMTTLGIQHIQCASDGSEALSQLTLAPIQPDVIICDLAMPGMDGLEFIRHLGTRGYRGSIILISGHSERLLGSACELVRSLDLRLSGAMRKPLDPKILGSLLEASIVPANPADARLVKAPALRLSAAELRAGIDAGSVEIMLQPQISVISRQTVGFEALLRWRDPTRGVLPPDLVIASAESAGLIDALTYCIFREATRVLALIQARGYPVTLSVNLSVENLAQLHLPETLLQIAAEQGVVPQQLILEVTESRLISNLAASLEVLGRLSLGGFRLSMDDFGTGYASLEMLQKLPFDELKIDRTFVTGAAQDIVTRTILRSSIELGRALGMTVVAEGIETQRELELVTMLGAEIGQGYFFAKPMALDDVLRWLTPTSRKPVAVA
jgi:EAL domain-containing protein (putative c-di-GMP-specific phosphodiesterase class I)/AmiR/NasT family two-component response regulator